MNSEPSNEYEQEQSSQQNIDINMRDANLQGEGSSLTIAPHIGPKIEVENQYQIISAEQILNEKFIIKSPYKGLNRFNISDQNYFFGRNKLVRELYSLVLESEFMLVLGASGSGKSSVVRAGLIPKLKEDLISQLNISEGINTTIDFVFTPGTDPFDSLYNCLKAEEKDYNFSEDEVSKAKKKGKTTLSDVVNDLRKDDEFWLIFIDQFEELFSHCSNIDTRENFIDSLENLLQCPKKYFRVIVAMRADFLNNFSAYHQLGNIFNSKNTKNTHFVTNMHQDELRLAIEQPAAKHGVVFEQGLVEQIIKEVQGQSGYLPLLQYTLDLLWKTECKLVGKDGKPHIQDRHLNRSIYDEIEGVRGALQKRINDIYNNFNQDQQAATKQIFSKLVHIVKDENGSRVTSRKADSQEFVGPKIEGTLQKFVDENIIVSSVEVLSQEHFLGESIYQDQNNTLQANNFVEVAHEIIINSWSLLRQWLDDKKDSIKLRNSLADDIKRWKSNEKSNEELLTGIRLDRSDKLRKENAFTDLGGLSDLENEYIDLSLQWQKKQLKNRAEFETTKEKNRILSSANKKARVIISISILVSLILMWLAREAQKNLTLARKGTKLEQAGVSALRQLRSGEIDSLIAALASSIELQQIAKNKNSLDQYPAVSPILALQKILDNIHEQNRLPVKQGQIKSTAFSPNGKYILTAGEDGTINLWHANGELIKSFLAHTIKGVQTVPASINTVTFSPDSKYIASASKNETASIWDLSGNKIINLTGKHTGEIRSISYHPGGEKIATSGSNGEVFIWDVSGTKVSQIKGHSGNVYDVQFSPDGQSIATIASDRTIRIWDLKGTQRSNWEWLKSENTYPATVNFSPDGKKILSSGQNNTAKIWSISGKELFTLKGHKGVVTSADFNPKSPELVTTSDDGTAKTWNLQGKLLNTLQGHRGVILTADFSPDGKNLITAGRDGTARLWNLRKSQTQLSQNFEGRIKHDLNAVAISKQGNLLVAAGDEGRVHLWNRSGQSIQSKLSVCSKGKVYATALNPKENLIAIAGEAQQVSLWNLSDGSKRCLKGHPGFVSSLSFSPDGQTLVSSGASGEAHVWNLEVDNEEPIVLKGHKQAVSNVAYHPQLDVIATAGWDGWISLWNRSGKLKKRWRGHQNKISALDISPDGKRIASADKSGTVHLWTISGEKKVDFFSYQVGVNVLKFIPNTSLLSGGGMDGTVRVWDLSGRQITEFSHKKGPIWSIDPTADGTKIFAGGTKGEVQLWKINHLQDLINQGCTWLQDYFKHHKDARKACVSSK